ncbi:3-hydroxy-3-methylglutaryl-CoA lyase [Xenorhabdus bovienii]|uniref:3-hydroxy-3-methylglutaryl-CoA lyase n=1 Tax=Xenorhabdus bovienii TaxID=40576 RepID=UPI00237C6EDE|nr:3-hydroxy-3-methylglutaryl-CoA lyase [Xenorhabdus bovienii]MDE1483349.1 3-hydroxy-3-methylglutaryl-CoA lyase [Xenorhabdus bovienii]MDE9430250.1 3-hydroxy-3-methylglutaryl-CoA lyase [Xenorhabdus bovienii]MDE9433380.1 3-hydroxy-3-methylglutaryl-CoA lyase [Xenorhabdus bovienii]MDE9442431.1 3-hydroxy-3-methylglutaryl-CoA lyase [Xenorhabdus bovienii]MDE9458915.1 3-hydroxy-3-methylglutaryl-CoA lyase [Xenorhabdus bovienii]
MVNNIDVTLRDGGYLNNFNFTTEYAINHVETLTKSGMEWFEIGYRNGSFKPISNIGLTGMSPDSYIWDIHRAVPEAKLVVIAHPHNINADDIHAMKMNGVSLLRLCIKADNPQPCLELCEITRAIGMAVSINFTRVSQLSVSKIIEVVKQCEHAGADIIYLADSNGSLFPEQVSQMFYKLKSATQSQLGFHPHDNLGLATANSIEAMKAGANFIDSSLSGMGKGAGNLNLESWLSFLNLSQNSKQYDLERVFTQLNELQSHCFFATSRRDLIDILMGMYNLSVENKTALEEGLQSGVNYAFQIVKSLQGG